MVDGTGFSNSDPRGYAPLRGEPRYTAPPAGAHAWGPADGAYHPPHADAYGQNQPHQDWAQYQHSTPHPDHMAHRSAGPARVSGVMHGLGAVFSVALLFGAGVWTWQMMQRDVAGVPVVRALEGPVRQAPDAPGGRQAAHQGLAVNELAASSEEARGDIALAPPPADLRPDDILPPRDVVPQTQTGDDTAPIPVALTTDISTPALGLRNPTPRAVARSPRPVARGRVPAQAPAQGTLQTAALTQPATRNDAGQDDVLAATVAESVAVGLVGTRGIDVDPATLGPGTRLVQLGAYDTPDAARAAWDQFARRFSPLLDDRGRVIEAAHSGGSVFFRLRAHGFNDERDARRFCSAFLAQQMDCIPVLIR